MVPAFSRPRGSIIGTTPEVETVIRRLPIESPAPSAIVSIAVLTLSKL